MRSEVCLIRPPVVLPVTTINAQMGVPPLGMAYLAGAIRSAGFALTIIDALGEDLEKYSKFEIDNLIVQGLTAERVVEKIPSTTKIIGLSCMFANEWIYAKKILRLIKEELPECFVIIGGEFPTADYKYLLKHYPDINCIVLGEGEETLLELCHKIDEAQLDLSQIKGIAYFRNGEVIQNPRRERIKDLQSIARPAWDLFPLENYLSRKLGYDTRNKRVIPMLASRGCPYQCTFCSSPQMWTTRWTARSVDALLEEIQDYQKLYQAEHFEFYDLTMIIKRDWIHEFCGEIIRRNLKFTWSLPSGTRTEVLDHETLSLMKASGCNKISLSPESGSPETLKRIKKHLNVKSMLNVAQNCKRTGVTAKANLIFGFPEQTKGEAFESLALGFKLALYGLDDLSCFRFAPYPGSELFYTLVDQRKLEQGEEYEKFLAFNTVSDLKNKKSWSRHISDWQISFFIFGGMSIFYSTSFLVRPWRLLFLSYRTIRGVPVTMLERMLHGMIHFYLQGKKTRKVELAN